MRKFLFLSALLAVLFLPDLADAGIFRGRRGGGSSGACASDGARRPLFQLFRGRCR
jgi:hypothetical protein